MTVTILGCYTDEPAGLGVPPYLGTYPRYLYGYFREKGEEVRYITIDDLRLLKAYKGQLRRKLSTDIRVCNLTRDTASVSRVLDETKELVVVLGVHTPGKYLSAVPGTLNEVIKLFSGLRCRKVLTGPAVFGTAVEGGRFFERADTNSFDSVKDYGFSYAEISKYAVLGSELVKQIPDLRIIEIETGHGCSRKKGCSFCLEPLKHKLEFRNLKDIINEINAFYKLGVRDFRLGKQSCFYTYPNSVKLLEEIKSNFTDIRTLHIDNVNPMMVLSPKGKRITEAIVRNCTSGNVAAFGVESFDAEVQKTNNLNCDSESVLEAVRIINGYGKEIGANGMQKFLPGINILFGLDRESRKTHEENMRWFKRILDEGLLLRRINIRQVNIFSGTPLFDSVGNKFLKRNKKYYWKWRNEIRQKIDFPMLQRLVPAGRVLKNVRMEIYDGNHTFGRQIGSYPLIVGVDKRVELKKFYDVKVKGHMLRSVVGEVLRDRVSSGVEGLN